MLIEALIELVGELFATAAITSDGKSKKGWIWLVLAGIVIGIVFLLYHFKIFI